MQISKNRKVNLLFRLIGEEKAQELDDYATKILQEKFIKIENSTQLINYFLEDMTEFFNQLTEDDLMDLRSYTGFHFKDINAVLRNNWTYQENGLLTIENQKKYKDLVQKIQKIMEKFPKPRISFYSYRGTTLESFAKYGIKSLEELTNMKDQYLYEEGFTSTSLLQDTSYFDKTLENGISYNIEIQYLIPKESQDGALLFGEYCSYSPSQNEYLITCGSLTKIIEVQIDQEKRQAKLVGVLIPKKMWNLQPTMKEIDEDKKSK